MFRNLKNDNMNKQMTHKIYVETQCVKKPQTVMSTINPLYEQGEYKTITITTSDLIQQLNYNLSYNLSQSLSTFECV